MVILNLLNAAKAPTGMWAGLILNVFSFIENYGWRMVLFTFCLKMVLSPIDIYQRYKARKNQLITLKLKPQMEKLQKVYGNDPKMLSQKQMELNKKAGISYFSSCLPSIITLVIFITLLYSGLQPISQYQNFREYELLNAKYHEVLDVRKEEEYDRIFESEWDAAYNAIIEDRENVSEYVLGVMKAEKGKAAYDKAIEEGRTKDEAEAVRLSVEDATTAESCKEELDARILEETEKRAKDRVMSVAVANVKEEAQQAVFEYYESDVRTGFLWIKNVWNADVPWTAPINDFNTFKTNIGDYGNFNSGKSGYASSAELSKMLSEYNDVMAKLLNDPEYNRANGYLVLPILTILLSIAMQIISFRMQKESGQMNAQSETQSKLMLFVMPVMMGYFAFQYTSAFAIYLVMNYFVSMLISVIGTVITKASDKKLEKELTTQVQSYGRPDFSDRNNSDKSKKK